MALGRDWSPLQTCIHLQLGSSGMDASVQGSLAPSEPADQTLLGWDLSEGLRLGERETCMSSMERRGTHDCLDLAFPPDSDPILLKSVALQGNNNPKSWSCLNRDLNCESGAPHSICHLGESLMCAVPHKEHNEVVQLERPFGCAGTQQALISCLTQLLPALL